MKQSEPTIRLAIDGDKNTWDSAVSHPLQSWAWGDFRSLTGVKIQRIVTEINHSLSSVYQLSYHPIPYSNYAIGYFPKGPELTAQMVSKLSEFGKKEHAFFIQLEPNISNLPNFPNLPHLVPSHRPLFTKHTFLLNLTKTEDQLLSAMHPKTRYNIKVAQKRGVKILEDNSGKAFDTYLSLSEETTNRQGFYAHDRSYHTNMWNIMHAANIAKLFTATYQGEILAAWIIFCWKDTIYYPYGASSRNHREVMAPTLLLWEITKWAKTQKYTSFDLWGALGPNPDINDPWYGFHRFKEGFGPTLITYAGSYDLILNPTLYKLYTLVDDIRWKYLKWRKK